MFPVSMSVPRWPATSVAVAVTSCVPAPSGSPSITVQVPSGATVTAPYVLPSTMTTIVAPGSPVPLTLVASTAVISTTVLVSTLNVDVSVATLPKRSVALASAVCEPSASVVVRSVDHVPSAAAVTVPITTPSTVTTTVAPGTAVPEMVGVASLVVEPLAGSSMVTTVLASTVNLLLARAVLPTPSVANASVVCAPLASGVATSITHVPSAATVTVPTVRPSTVTTMLAPGSPVPRISGVESAVVEPSAGATIPTRVERSTVNVALSVAARPAAVMLARTVCTPSVSAVVGVRVQVPSAAAVMVPTEMPSTSTVTVVPGVAVPE